VIYTNFVLLTSDPAPSNLNKELMNSELLENNNKHASKDDDDDDPSQDIPYGKDAEEEIEEMEEGTLIVHCFSSFAYV
jgi:hypothetical protein